MSPGCSGTVSGRRKVTGMGLVRHAQPHRSPDAEVERFLHLWEAAGETSSIPAAAPAVPNRSLRYTPEAVQSRLVFIMTDARDAISTEMIPQSVRAFARYAPDKYATLSTAVLLAWLRDHSDFHAAVLDWCRESRPDAIDVTGSDSATAAAAALLLDEDAAHYYLAVTMRQGPSPALSWPSARPTWTRCSNPRAPT